MHREDIACLSTVFKVCLNCAEFGYLIEEEHLGGDVVARVNGESFIVVRCDMESTSRFNSARVYNSSQLDRKFSFSFNILVLRECEDDKVWPNVFLTANECLAGASLYGLEGRLL